MLSLQYGYGTSYGHVHIYVVHDTDNASVVSISLFSPLLYKLYVTALHFLQLYRVKHEKCMQVAGQRPAFCVGK